MRNLSRRIGLVAVSVALLFAGCSADGSPGSVPVSVPDDLAVPPTALYDPPLDLSGLLGLPEQDAVRWGERQGFQIIEVLGPDDGAETDINPTRLSLLVDDGIVINATQG